MEPVKEKKVSRRQVRLLYLVVGVSLFCLIDKIEGASTHTTTTAPTATPTTTTTKEPLVFTAGVKEPTQGGQVGPLDTTTTVTTAVAAAVNSGGSSGAQEEEEEAEGKKNESPRGLFSRPVLQRRNKRRRTTTATSTVKTPSNLTLSERLDDLEYSFENGTEVVEGNKTVRSGARPSTTSTTTTSTSNSPQDPLCPEEHSTSSRGVYQSTLPAYEMILFAIVNVVGFVVFLYFWKNIYFETEDLYATVSPYGFGPGPSTPAPQARSLGELDKIMRRVEKSIQ